jgi:hypothetical protein
MAYCGCSCVGPREAVCVEKAISINMLDQEQKAHTLNWRPYQRRCDRLESKQALRADLVIATWKDLLKNIPPENIDWIDDSNEVLVGNRFFDVW